MEPFFSLKNRNIFSFSCKNLRIPEESYTLLYFTKKSCSKTGKWNLDDMIASCSTSKEDLGNLMSPDKYYKSSLCNHSFWDDSPWSSFASTWGPWVGKRWGAELGSVSDSLTIPPADRVHSFIAFLPLLPTAIKCSICYACTFGEWPRSITQLLMLP